MIKKILLSIGMVLSLILILLVSVIAIFLIIDHLTQMDYYLREENYIEVTGTITHIAFDDEDQYLCLGFSDLSENFADNCFEIVGDNYKIVKKFKEHIEIGKTATFVTAPAYWGDGFIMPMVSLEIDNTCLLEYEIGLSNFLAWKKYRP